MTTHTTIQPLTRPATTAGRYVVGAIFSGFLVAVGLFLAVTAVELGFAVGFVGLAAGAWCLSALDDAKTLARLNGRTLGELAVPLPVFPSVSSHPHRDASMLAPGVPAVVALPDGGWGLISRDVAHGAASRIGFNGRWHSVAQHVELLDPATPADSIRRIPRASEALLVDRRPVPAGVTGAAIRAHSATPATARTSTDAI